MLCRSVYAHGFTAGQKTVENQDWAAEPPGHGGPWAVADPWPLGRGPAFRKTHLLRGALRFFSIISTLCFLSSRMFFVGYIKLFLTREKIFICLMASTITQRVSTIYIVVTKAPFFGHYACFKTRNSDH